MRKVKLDPRTKMFLLIITVVIATIFRNLDNTLILVGLIGVLGISLGRVKNSIISTIVFVLLYLLNIYYIRDNVGNFYTMLTAWLSLVYQLYPCFMMSSIIVRTTSISEFMTGLQRMSVPRGFIITFSVFLRYMPVISEDFSYINDSMKMRDVGVSVKGIFTHPKRTVECVYVPLLISASKVADDLTMASVTRGIENPKHRTSCIEIGFKIIDIFWLVVFVLYATFSIVQRFL